MEETKNNFTQGKILGPLIRFAFPVLIALFLQSLYGAVDLLIVGQFGLPADVSGVSTGSQILMTFTNIVAGFAMGMTVLLGQKIGEGKREEGGSIIGAGITLFAMIGVGMTLLLTVFAPQISTIMNAPEEAFEQTVSYVRICGAGSLIIIAYNLIGSVFRGIGDSQTPLLTVLIACIFNIGGDLLLVAVLHMGTSGAAIATVAAQAVSVVLSFLIIRRKKLPFSFRFKQICLNKTIHARISKIGFPIALQELLVGISFLVILAIVNAISVSASAGVGVGEKVCAFIMLVPSAFMQSISAFVAQNYGAGRMDRATKALQCGIMVSMVIGVVMAYLSFFHGDLLAGIFSNNEEVIKEGADYLKAYGIDCVLTPVFFCFIGFYNGIGQTRFVMLQGIVSAFCVRVPVSYLMSKWEPVSVFHIGLATPMSSMAQIIMCVLFMIYIRKKLKNAQFFRHLAS